MVIQDYVKKHFEYLHSKDVSRSTGLRYLSQLVTDDAWDEIEAIIASMPEIEKLVANTVLYGHPRPQLSWAVWDAFADSLQEHLETLESEAEDLPDSKAHEASLINRGDY